MKRWATGNDWKLIAFFCPNTLRIILRSFSVRICAHCWKYSRQSVPRVVQPGNDTYNPANNFSFVGHTPPFGQAEGRRGGLYHETRAILVKPPATVALVHFYKVYR